MSPRVSVLVDLTGVEGPARPLLASLDAQTLPPRDFEILLTDVGGDRARSAELDVVAAHAPNLRVVEVRSPQAPLAAGLAASVGEHVLVLDPTDRLAPTALASLLTAADQVEGSAVVLADEVTPGAPRLRPVDPRPGATTPAADLPADAADVRMLVRRDQLASASATASRRALGAQALELIGSATLARGDGPCVFVRQVDPRTTEGWTGRRPRARDVSATWSAGTVRLAATVSPVPDGTTLVASLRNAEGRELDLPTEQVGGDGDSADVAMTIDLGHGPGPEVPDGAWDLVLTSRLGQQQARSRFDPIGEAPVRAIVDGRPVAIVTTSRSRTALVVGHPKVDLLHGADLTASSVVESVNGSLLTLPLRLDHVSGSHRRSVKLWLGDMPVHASLETSDGSAVLTSLVSGLPGRVPLSLDVGGNRVRSQLTLVIGGAGAMSVEPARRGPTRSTGAEGTTRGTSQQGAGVEPAVRRALVRGRRLVRRGTDAVGAAARKQRGGA